MSSRVDIKKSFLIFSQETLGSGRVGRKGSKWEGQLHIGDCKICLCSPEQENMRNPKLGGLPTLTAHGKGTAAFFPLLILKGGKTPPGTHRQRALQFPHQKQTVVYVADQYHHGRCQAAPRPLCRLTERWTLRNAHPCGSISCFLQLVRIIKI